MIVMPPMEWPARTASRSIGRLEHRGQVVGQRRQIERGGAATAQSVAALVVEDDPRAVFDQAAGDRQPDLVTTAPTVGEDDDRRVGPLARDIPHGQGGAVGRRHRQRFRTGQDAPAEASVVVVGPAGGAAALRLEAPIGRQRRRRCPAPRRRPRGASAVSLTWIGVRRARSRRRRGRGAGVLHRCQINGN